ncbi:MAG: hypothetical protein WC462_03855 [archaeon]
MICKNCVLPISTGKDFCENCEKLVSDPHYKEYFSKRTIFKKDFEDFLGKTKRIVFAYSGGLDSTVVLHKLNLKCKEKGIELSCFTLDHGFKGNFVKNNIQRVIEFEGLKKNHVWVDISGEKALDGNSVKNYFTLLSVNGIIPCGKKCNTIIDFAYKKILDSFGEKILFTGGDTPAWSSSLNRYSIFWEKPLFTVLRGGIAFGLNKKMNAELIKKENIPWQNPDCGGCDTDCLLPGAVLRVLQQKGFDVGVIFSNLDAARDYFYERVRWKIIDREIALNELKIPPLSGKISFSEFKDITGYCGRNL